MRRTIQPKCRVVLAALVWLSSTCFRLPVCGHRVQSGQRSFYRAQWHCVCRFRLRYSQYSHMQPTRQILWVPGNIQRLMIGSKVAAVRSGTSTRKHLLVLLSTAPNTQCLSLHWPLWYFRWKNFLSSISTSIVSPFSLNPPSSWGLFSIFVSHKSRMKVHQWLTVGFDWWVCHRIWNCRKSADQHI